jgi:hypothetical protein
MNIHKVVLAKIKHLILTALLQQELIFYKKPLKGVTTNFEQ